MARMVYPPAYLPEGSCICQSTRSAQDECDCDFSFLGLDLSNLHRILTTQYGCSRSGENAYLRGATALSLHRHLPSWSEPPAEQAHALDLGYSTITRRLLTGELARLYCFRLIVMLPLARLRRVR